MSGNILMLLLVFLLSACRNDYLGLLRSTDLDDRLKEQNNFRFLRPEDRALSLGDEYAFIVLSDIHIERGNANGLEKLKAVIEADSAIKFVVINGDITQCGYREDIEKFIEIARSLEIPCYPVIGNHDIYFNNWPNWKDLIGSTRYRVDGGGVTLFMLDSANSFLGKDQLNWLDSELKSAGGRIFVFSHVNLFVEAPADIQQLSDARERARIISVLNNRVDIMFMGHSHKRNYQTAGGVRYQSTEDFRKNKTYCRVSVEHTGVTYRFEKL